MKTIETMVTITPDQEFQIQRPTDLPLGTLPIGTFKVVLVIDDLSTVGAEPATTIAPHASSEAEEDNHQSFLEAAREFMGCIKDAPSDLSVNPQYMAGYGQ